MLHVGDVGMAGSAAETNGVWTIQGAGADIWSHADAFHFVYAAAASAFDTGTDFPLFGTLTARIDDLRNTNPFAKAGIMIRSSLSADAATVLLDVKPNGEIEFMQRVADGGEMTYLGGAVTTTPIWLQISWNYFIEPSVVVSSSTDGVNWSTIGSTLISNILIASGRPPLLAGAIVTSHDTTQLNVAHVED